MANVSLFVFNRDISSAEFFGRHSFCCPILARGIGHNTFILCYHCSPHLTWRDVQHLTVLTSKRNHLYDPTESHQWTINGAGLEFNHLFGYGVLDAGDIVDLARQWQTAPDRWHCAADTVKGPL